MGAASTHEGGQPRFWTPSNIITVIRICLVPVFVGALLAPWPEWWNMPAVTNDVKCIVAAILFIVISGTDWLDGYLARHRNEVTDFGKFMDPLADKILVTAALISLVELHALPTWAVLIILAREFIVSGLRMMAAAKGVVIAASHLGKFKTVFQMAAIVLFTIKDIWRSVSPDNGVPEAMYVFSWIIMGIALALTVISLIDYLVKAHEIIGVGSTQGHSCDVQRIAAVAVAAAREAGLSFATAESLTGGMIGSTITGIPGASEVFKGGIVSYASSVKREVLGVSDGILETEGAVSSACAEAMARGAREKLASDCAVAVTGIAGPGGAEPGKPVGTVWIGFADRSGSTSALFTFEGDRESVRMQTVAAALEKLSDALVDGKVRTS